MVENEEKDPDKENVCKSSKRGRPRKKPDYDAEQQMEDLLAAVADAYLNPEELLFADKNGHTQLKLLAEQFQMTPLKIRKLLITAEVYQSSEPAKAELPQKIAQMKADGMALEAIMKELNLSRASIHSYLPYSKGAYKTKTVSCNADRVRIYRERKEAVAKLQEVLRKAREWDQTKERNQTRKRNQNEIQSRVEPEEMEMQLWNTLLLFQEYPFHTSKGLKFTYSIKGNELFVTRKEKSITRSTILMAFQKALSLEGIVSGPKKLGTFGASYLYPIFMRIGVVRQKGCSKPEDVVDVHEA